MNKVTDIVNPDWEANEFQLAKDMVDYGMSLYYGLSERNREIHSLYRMYHGRYTAKELTEMTTVHGQVSATPLKPYRLSKVKIDQLLGESLEVGFSLEVDTISPVEKQKKKEEVSTQMGRSYMKPVIESVRKNGFDIYPGVDIPEYSDELRESLQSFKTRNEMISQRIVNEKVKDALEENLYYYAFASNVFSSEIFTKSIVNDKGKTGLELIQPERMIYPKNNFDQFNSAAPIIGHWDYMTFAEIIRNFNISKDSKEYTEIANHFSGLFTTMDTTTMVAPNVEQDIDFTGQIPNDNTRMAVPVYMFQWKYYTDKAIIKNTDGSIEYENLPEDAKLKDGSPLQTLRFERIFEGASVNGTVYIGFHDLKDFAVTRDADGRIHAITDYVCTLVKTFGGIRTPFAKVMLDLNRQHDYARWLLFREIKKSKGGSMYFDRAFMGERSKHSILFDLEDSGLVEYTSKNKFDESQEGLLKGDQVIGAINFGSSSNLIRDLISICMDLERVLDTVTGINDSRKGTEMATTTATTAQNNLQASRSVTYDMFYFTESHMQRAFTHLIQKTKSVIYHGSNEAYSYLPLDDLTYLQNNLDYFQDDFQARIVGGRRSQQIFSELSNIIAQEAASGKRSSADFVEIKEAKSLKEAVEILRNSDARLQEIAKSSEDAANQTKLQMNEASNQAMIANREDEQAAKQQLQNSINATAMSMKQLESEVKLITTQIAAQVQSEKPKSK